MFNMVFADIFSIMVELVNGNTLNIPGNVITTMGIAAFVTNIPISMIFFSSYLPLKASRTANLIIAPLTMVYVIGGGSSTPHYIICAGMEVALLLVVLRIAWRWKGNELQRP